MKLQSPLVLFVLGTICSYLQACERPLGMENGSIQATQIIIGGNIAYSRNVNMLRYKSPLGWCTIQQNVASFHEDRYIEIDLKTDHLVSSLLLQGGNGNHSAYSYGSKIKVQWRDSKTSSFVYYNGSDGTELKLRDWKDRTAEQLKFNPPLCAKYLRLLPFLNENHVCLRFEILGCSGCSDSQTTEAPLKSMYTTGMNTYEFTTAGLSSFKPVAPTKTQGSKESQIPSGMAEKTSESTTTVIIVVVCMICLILIIALVAYGAKSGRFSRCIRGSNNTAKQKRKKNACLIKTEVACSNIDEPEVLYVNCNDDSQQLEMETAYSSVYATPVTSNQSQTGAMQSNIPFNMHLQMERKQTVNYTEPIAVPQNYKDLIHDSSKIYESPYQAVTGSSYYADPNILASKDPICIAEFPREKLRFLEKIGEGQFGEVHICEVENLADFANDGTIAGTALVGVTKVAVKLLKCGQDSSIAEEFMKEVRVMSKLRHENIVQLIGVCLDEPKCMIVEYMENGDLIQFMQTHKRYTGPQNLKTSLMPSNSLSNDTLFYITMQVAAGMNFLASQGFVHRDLAARNCLVGHSFTVKIADFGMSRNLYTKQYYRIEGMTVLPIRWMAPESICYGTFTTQTDVWSFGVTVWEIFMFAAEQPFAWLSDKEVIENALALAESPTSGFKMLKKPDGCPDVIYTMILQCWQRAPKDRPTFQELFERCKELIPNSLGEPE